MISISIILLYVEHVRKAVEGWVVFPLVVIADQ